MGDGQLGAVLVHGFNSGPETWRHVQERIAQDPSLGDVRMLPFAYATGIVRWDPRKVLQVFPQISTIADSLREYLHTEAGAFEGLVLVTHSMGGLVVQRYLARMLADGRGRELARIRRVVMLACPNDGSELLRSLRRQVFGRRGRNPQERELRPLDEQVAETRRVIVNQVLGATEVTERTCPVPFFVYAGESDGVVPVASARSVFKDAAALPGDHFSILKATTSDHRTFTTLRRHLHEAGAACSGSDQSPGKAAAGATDLADSAGTGAGDGSQEPAQTVTNTVSGGPGHGGVVRGGTVHVTAPSAGDHPVRPPLPDGPAGVARPRQVGVIPPRAGAFQDRAERARLRKAVTGGGTAVLGQAQLPGTAAGQVLSGMGGVGKTQLAADYARSALTGGELDLLVWVTAADRTSLVAGLGRAGVEIAGAQPDDPLAAAEAFTAWLEPKAGQEAYRWLVVLDDVSDPADLQGLWPPASPHGRTLITTRRRDAAFTHDGRTRIEVGLFSQAEAVSYLSAVLALHDRTEPAEQLAALAQDLGHLPLALSQAAAFMADADMAAADYRALLADRTASLADASPQPLPPGHARAMAAAWDLSIEHADRMRPVGLGRPLLHLAAFLDANGIPAAVLTTPPALAYQTEHRTSHEDRGVESAAVPSTSGVTIDDVTAADVTAALRVLHRLNLIDHTPRDVHREVRVHALIQRAVRDTLTPDQHHRTATTTADALMAAWPEIERDTTLAQALRANTTALTTRAQDALYRPDAHTVLFRAGSSLGNSGQVNAAITYHQHLAAETTEHLGPNHPDTLAARNNLVYWWGEAGDATRAATAFAELLEDRVRVLGPDHPDTLTTRNNLATWQQRKDMGTDTRD